MNAPHPRPKGEGTDDPRDEIEAKGTDRVVFWGAHNRWECCRRSFSVEPCHKCCRCFSRDECDHPPFAEWDAA